jgi:hypothetical protein
MCLKKLNFFWVASEEVFRQFIIDMTNKLKVLNPK